LPASADPRALARLAAATIHTLSIRARARIPRAEILPILDDAARTICGPISTRTSAKLGEVKRSESI
jgi:TetR/AcrR family transcriptional regulator, copper-responsive repressor